MDRFASMHDEDIDKLGIPKQQGPGGGEGGWKGRKRARELSELKGKLDRASEKEQQSWDLLKQAVEGGGCAADEGRFKATGTNRAAEEMRERTVGLVTAEEFRKAREAADSLEAAEIKRREEQEAAEQERLSALHRKAEKRKRKAAEKKKRLQKSKMSFALEEDVEEGGEETPSGDEKALSRTTPADRQSSSEQINATSDDQGVRSGEARRTLGAEQTGDVCGGDGFTAVPPSDSRVGDRNLKGAATDEDNSNTASVLRARLGR